MVLHSLPPTPGPGLVSEDLLPGDQRQELSKRGEGFPHHGLWDPQAPGHRGRGDAGPVEGGQGPERQDQQRPSVAGRGETDARSQQLLLRGDPTVMAEITRAFNTFTVHFEETLCWWNKRIKCQFSGKKKNKFLSLNAIYFWVWYFCIKYIGISA